MEPVREIMNIMWMECVDSTNSELRRRIDTLDNLSVVAAYEQTSGRGQGTHTWFSSPHTNLMFSMFFKFTEGTGILLDVKDMLLVTEIITLGIRDYLASNGISSRIKWPNDIWVADKKICGILIENILDHERITDSIVGVGLDVNEQSWPADLPNPVSMNQLTGKTYVLEDELSRLTAHIASRYDEMRTQIGRERLDYEFRENMFRLP